MADKVFRAEKGRDLPAVQEPQVQQPVVPDPTTPVTGQQQVVTTPSSDQQKQDNYIPYVDWDRAMKEGKTWGLVASDKNYRLKDHNYSYVDLRNNYNEWAKKNGYPELSVYDFMAYTQDKDISKSPEDNVKEERRKKWEDASEQLGYMLTNLGNFIGAGLGAPEPTNAPDSVKLTERQQRLRDKTDSLRRAYNKDWLQAYTKQKAEERQAEVAKANAEYKASQAKATQQRADDNTRVSDSRIERYQALNEQGQQRTEDNTRMTDSRIERYNVQNKVNQQNANTASAREGRLAKGTTKVTTKDGESVIVENRPGTGGTDKYSKYKRSQQSDYSKYKRQK